MFTELQKMLRKGDSLTVSIALETDTQLRVNVYPKLFTLDAANSENRAVLNTPLSLVATPVELDSPAFLDTLNQFASSATELRHTLDEVTAAHKTAATNAKAGKGNKPKPEPKAADADADDDDSESDKPAAAAKKPEPKPADAKAATGSLL